MSEGSIEKQVVGAIRLALVAAADDRTALTTIRWLLDQAPETLADDTSSPRLLIDGIRACGLSLSTFVRAAHSTSVRKSIRPTYDHRNTGDRFTVETRIDGRRISVTPTRDPFVNHRVTIGLLDIAHALVRRRLVVEVIIGGDPQIVGDVMELDADCLTYNSTRRSEWDARVNRSLKDFEASA